MWATERLKTGFLHNTGLDAEVESHPGILGFAARFTSQHDSFALREAPSARKCREVVANLGAEWVVINENVLLVLGNEHGPAPARGNAPKPLQVEAHCVHCVVDVCLRGKAPKTETQ